MINNGPNPHHIPIINPLAQLILFPYMAAAFHEVPRLSTAGRGVITVEGPLPSIVPPARDPLDPLTPLADNSGTPGGTIPPVGPQSPMISQLSLYGDIYPR